MRVSARRLLGAGLATFLLFAFSVVAGRAAGDECDGIYHPETETCLRCGQPHSTGETPLASDVLAILRAAVGQPVFVCTGERFCLCDVNCDGEFTTTDALMILRRAVGQPVPLNCCCMPDAGSQIPCGSLEFIAAGSDLDQGWTGIAHDADLSGAAFTASVKRECSTSASECLHDDDCPGSETCEATCDCGLDGTCELTGPSHQKRCRTDLEPCTTNADCDPDVSCEHLLGPPLPLSSGGTPLCVVHTFADSISGTLDTTTGEAKLSTMLRARVFLGIAIDQPCPRCGESDHHPQAGDTFACEGGQKPGQACTVHAVSPDFGGVSFDCPPTLDGGVSGSGLVIRLGEITTGTTSKTAGLPCRFFGFTGNPTVPGSNPKCTDRIGTGDPVCSSNADCRRCTGDLVTSCTGNGDCTGNGTCAEAPDQPVTCGFWCHCGFCNDDPGLPCFESGDCPDGQICQAGTGAANTANMGQQRPNDCSQDGFVCGGGEEKCATTLAASCSDQPYRTCETNADCENAGAGVCNVEPRPCFESRITRTGAPTPRGAYCAVEAKSCDTNADCTAEGDFCIEDAMRSETVALFCMPPTSKSGVNSSSGVTGPAAIRLSNVIRICRCGDGAVGCDEGCDDGNTGNGDGCDEICRSETGP